MDNYELVGHPILKNFVGDIDKDIDWKHQDKETYLEMEKVMIDGVKLFDPFIIDDFYPQEMFDELVEICNQLDLKRVDYSNQMNKWEEGIEIPQKFIDYAVQRVRDALQIEDVHFGYHMYAHHQITEDGRIPKLPLHIDWAPGAYMVDLQIGGNRDWGFVARYTNFVCKPNQAVICQPQLDYHYRPSWASNDPNEYYQAIFFHLINKNNWHVSNSEPLQDRSPELNAKYNFGPRFRDEEPFVNYQLQKRYIFDKPYLKTLMQTDAPPIPWDEIPTKEDANVHQRRNVAPATNKGIKND